MDQVDELDGARWRDGWLIDEVSAMQVHATVTATLLPAYSLEERRGGGMQRLTRRSNPTQPNRPCGNSFLAVFARWVLSQNRQRAEKNKE